MLMRTPTRWARPKLVRPPGFIVPCRPTLAANVPTGDGWLHELKHDGFRIIAHNRDCRRRARPPRLPHRARRRSGRALPGGVAALQPAAERRRPGERLSVRLRPALA